MNYLYHWVPKNMKGDILYPLNTLKEKYPELYGEHINKYKGREEILDLIIPTLQCLWNDAIHLSAIHPKAVKDAIAEAGGRSDYKMFCYQIDPHLLEPDKATVYLYTTPELDMTNVEDFREFNPDDIGRYSILSKETIEHYKDSYKNGRKPLPFNRAPHILYKGTIDVKGMEIIEV